MRVDEVISVENIAHDLTHPGSSVINRTNALLITFWFPPRPHTPTTCFIVETVRYATYGVQMAKMEKNIGFAFQFAKGQQKRETQADVSL